MNLLFDPVEMIHINRLVLRWYWGATEGHHILLELE
jgi:hypothetical protein